MEDQAGIARFIVAKVPLTLWAFALVGLTIVIRLPALLHRGPIDDEAAYCVVANEIVDGGRPYVDAVDRKPPLLYWTYFAVVRVAGKFNWTALHTFALLWTLATLAGMWVAGRRLFDCRTGLMAALLYSIYQPWGTWKNLALNGELLMNLPLVWAWAIGLGWSPRRPIASLNAGNRGRVAPELFMVGVLLASGFLLKQPAAIAAVPLIFYLGSSAYRAEHGCTLIDSATQIGLLASGFAMTLTMVASVLAVQGVLPDAFYWAVLDHDVPYVFWTRGAVFTLAFVGACLPLCLAAAASARRPSLWEGQRAERAAVLGWLVASAVGTAASARFYPHYYIQLVPPLSLLAAPFLTRVVPARTVAWLRPGWLGLWLAATFVVFAVLHWWRLPVRVEPTQAGRYVSEQATPDDRLFVWGQAPQIYLDARRRPASRYIITFPLTGHIFGGSLPDADTRNRILPGAWANLEEDFQHHPPEYIVDVETDPAAMYPIGMFPVLARLIDERYHLVARTAEGRVYQRNASNDRQ